MSEASEQTKTPERQRQAPTNSVNEEFSLFYVSNSRDHISEKFPLEIFDAAFTCRATTRRALIRSET